MDYVFSMFMMLFDYAFLYIFRFCVVISYVCFFITVFGIIRKKEFSFFFPIILYGCLVVPYCVIYFLFTKIIFLF